MGTSPLNADANQSGGEQQQGIQIQPRAEWLCASTKMGYTSTNCNFRAKKAGEPLNIGLAYPSLNLSVLILQAIFKCQCQPSKHLKSPDICDSRVSSFAIWPLLFELASRYP